MPSRPSAGPGTWAPADAHSVGGPAASQVWPPRQIGQMRTEPCKNTTYMNKDTTQFQNRAEIYIYFAEPAIPQLHENSILGMPEVTQDKVSLAGIYIRPGVTGSMREQGHTRMSGGPRLRAETSLLKLVPPNITCSIQACWCQAWDMRGSKAASCKEIA
jgi:hypothetical protein